MKGILSMGTNHWLKLNLIIPTITIRRDAIYRVSGNPIYRVSMKNDLSCL